MNILTPIRRFDYEKLQDILNFYIKKMAFIAPTGQPRDF